MKYLFKYFKLVCSLLLFVCASWLAFRIVSVSNNTFERNGKWIVSKTLLNRGVMGAFGFLSWRNALSGDRADLSKWHGFQEIIYKDAVKAGEVRFDFLFGEESYLDFIFNKDSEGFSGIRLSAGSLFKSRYFTAKSSGEFLTSESFTFDNLKKGKWNHCGVVMSPGFCELYINGKEAGKFSVKQLEAQKIGFRGGENTALIDNISVFSGTSQRIIFEDFSNGNLKYFLLSFLSVAIVNALAAFIFTVIFRADFISKAALLNAGLVTLFLAALFYLSLSRYPKNDEYMSAKLREEQGKYWENSTPEFIRSEIMSKYGIGHSEGMRIMFIGSSQTWGAGASAESKTLVNRAEEKLNGAGGAKRYECINTGISGMKSGDLLKLYREEWAALKPEMVLVNLATNDEENPEAFSDNLKEMVRINKAQNIRTIFVLEANSIEYHPGPLKLHKVMKEIAAVNGLTVVDLHGYLIDNHEKGFLWWDYVHLTDFGQELAGEYIYQAIKKEIAFS